jgi:NADH-quinone oxidoreductase subunit G
VSGEPPGSRLGEIVRKVRSVEFRALVALGEDVTQCGFSGEDLAKLSSLIVMDILPSATTAKATVLLPASSFAEKRGSMINGKGRLQRLNRAIAAPGDARDDWEILRDLVQQLTGSNGVYLIEDVFNQIARAIPDLNSLSLSRIGDSGVHLEHGKEATAAVEKAPV